MRNKDIYCIFPLKEILTGILQLPTIYNVLCRLGEIWLSWHFLYLWLTRMLGSSLRFHVSILIFFLSLPFLRFLVRFVRGRDHHPLPNTHLCGYACKNKENYLMNYTIDSLFYASTYYCDSIVLHQIARI